MGFAALLGIADARALSILGLPKQLQERAMGDVVIHRAVLSLRETLLREGPEILKSKTQTVGGEPRLQAYPGPNDTSGPHVDGRALDILLHSERDSECSIADTLIECFLYYREEMEWETIIYNREEWNIAGAKSARILSPSNKYPGRDFEHRTHIHIQWPEHKKQLDYSYAISLALAEKSW